MLNLRPDGRTTAVVAALLAPALVCLAGAPAMAHPHVWVSTKAAVQFEAGTIVALRFTWLFDEMYSTMATDGLDKNGDGSLSREELDELVKVNMEGLKEFDYFTEVKSADKVLSFGEPRDAFMQVVKAPADAGTKANTGMLGGLLSGPATASGQSAAAQKEDDDQPVSKLALHFTLPLQHPAAAHDFKFTVRDTTIFIWFEPAREAAVKLVGAPSDCSYKIAPPELTEEQKRLNEAFGSVGGLPTQGGARMVRVTCGGTN